MSPVAYRRTTVTSILELRHRILRPEHAIAEVMFAEDHDPASRHYGAYDSSGKNICCLSLLPSAWQEQPAWRLRAMAKVGLWRGLGIGVGILGVAMVCLALGDRRGIQLDRRTDMVSPITVFLCIFT